MITQRGKSLNENPHWKMINLSVHNVVSYWVFSTIFYPLQYGCTVSLLLHTSCNLNALYALYNDMSYCNV